MGKKNAIYNNTGVDGYADLIRKALKSKGLYVDSLEITIHMLACGLRRFAEIQTKLDADKLMLEQTTREGNTKYTINPLFVMGEHQAEQIRKYLRELKLTNLSSSAEAGDSGDELGRLYDAIDGVNGRGPHLLHPKKVING